MPPCFKYFMQRTASFGSKPMMTSAPPSGMSGENTSSPVRTWLTTQPPRCDMPIVSAVRAFSPLRMAANAIKRLASTVPCPPTPHNNVLVLILHLPLFLLQLHRTDTLAHRESSRSTMTAPRTPCLLLSQAPGSQAR